MSDTQITLMSGIFGMGTQQHAHVHRHNTLNVDSMGIDTLKMESYQGGITPNTLNNIAMTSGGISTQPQGMVNMEGGWNLRRGLGMLKFMVTRNSLVQEELAVVGYLHGGSYDHNGISGDTMFVPVRSWSSVSRSVADAHGFPMVKHAIDQSSQFLMGDPDMMKKLRSMRPLDVAQEALGHLACEEDGRGAEFGGQVTSDLQNNVVVSKTSNLNPTNHSRALLRLGVEAQIQAEHGSLELGLADGLMGQGLGELSVNEDPFFRTMMFNLGVWNLNGFMGFSLNEIQGVFTNLPNVLNVQNLNPTSFAADDTILVSSEYGTANLHEVIATELAFITVHLLMQVGLTSLYFYGTNNPMDFNGMAGSEDGVVVGYGHFMSAIDHDDTAINRVENFINLLKMHFFAKYTQVHAHMRTLMNIQVETHMFGETTVQLFFNGDQSIVKQFTNATYCINRTSTNISGSDVGLTESKNYLTNIREYF